MRYTAKSRSRAKPPIDKEISGWPKGYYSVGAEGGIPEDALSDLTNSDLTRTDLPTQRPSLSAYGSPYLGICIGQNTFNKVLPSGKRQYYEISMQVIEGAAKVCTRRDGMAWEVVPGDYTFSIDHWANFTHSNSRVYITNNEDRLGYYDIVENKIVSYVGLAAPAPPTLTKDGLATGSNIYTYYYVITALGTAGETNGSAEASMAVPKLRESWTDGTDAMNLTFTLPTNSEGANIYVGTAPGDVRLVAVIPKGVTTWKDNGSAVALATKRPPLANSTAGPVLTYLVNILGQLIGWGDKNNPSYIWFDGGAGGKEYSGNFTISGGGGYIAIDDGGPSIPVAVVPFRTGKGDPTPGVICRNSAGVGGFRHLSFQPQTIGDFTAIMPSITEANGNIGSVSPRATIGAGDSVHFPDGTGFSFYGSAPNIPNILSTNRSSMYIEPDCRKLNLSAMEGAVGIHFEGRNYYALPVLSETNNQIWVQDISSNPAKWIMPWLISAKHMWLYEDNSGTTHFCLLVGNKQYEFKKNSTTTDDGVPFRTRVASGPLRAGKTNVRMMYVEKHRVGFLSPRGKAKTTVRGTGRDTTIEESDDMDLPTIIPNTGFGQFNFGENEFGEDPMIDDVSRPTSKTLPVVVKSMMNELYWEVTTNTANARFTIGSTHTEGMVIPKLYAGD